MDEKNQEKTAKELFKKLSETTSEARLTAYLIAAGYRYEKALELYLWNSKISQSLYMLLQACEISARNRINISLCDIYGQEWWQNKDFKTLIENDHERLKDIDLVLKRLRNRKIKICNDQVVASMSFGFWLGMLEDRYNPAIWSSYLRFSFPHFPENRGRKSLKSRTKDIVELRNRISHHEPVIKRDLSKDYSNILEFLRWMCPEKEKWIKPHSEFPKLLRQKP